MYTERKKEVLEKKAELLKVMGHPARLCVLSCLLEKDGCNVTTLIEEMCLPQSTVSQHISKLRTQGIISGKRNGLEITYSVVDKEVKDIMGIIKKELEMERST